MNLCISNIAWDKAYDDKIYKVCSDKGFDGIEIAPSRLFQNNPYEHTKEASFWAKRLYREFGLKVFSCQSIWYGKKENIFGSDEERESLLEYSKKVFEFVNAVGAKNAVFGCPKNRNGYKNDSEENDEIAVDFFGKLAENAKKADVILSIEANPRIYGTDFLNTTGEAINFIRRATCDSLKLNCDLGTMLYNQEKVEIIRGAEKLIGHVHISEPNLEKINRHQEHIDILSVLKCNNYDGAVSIEMKKQDNLEKIFEVMDYVRQLYAVY